MKPNGPTSRLSGDCAIEGCDRPLFRQGLCGSHFKRKQRKQQVNVPIGSSIVEGGLSNCEVLSPEEICIIAGNALLEVVQQRTPEETALISVKDFLEADGDKDYKEKRKKLLKAMEKWMESRGWSPPRTKKGKR